MPVKTKFSHRHEAELKFAYQLGTRASHHHVPRVELDATRRAWVPFEDGHRLENLRGSVQIHGLASIIWEVLYIPDVNFSIDTSASNVFAIGTPMHFVAANALHWVELDGPVDRHPFQSYVPF